MRSTIFALCAALALVPACKKADPNNVDDMVAKLKNAKSQKEKLSAVDALRKIGKKECVPGLIEALKETGKVREAAAVALGELKDPSAVGPLGDAMDLSVAGGTDSSTVAANSANKEIARALGNIGDKAAAKTVSQLLKVTKDNYVKIEAINTLGSLKDPAAVPVLSEIAIDERIETLINKKAIQALSKINDPAALPVYFRMLFLERKGMSFYPESAYGIFLLGDAANDKVLTALKGEDKELLKLAKERDLVEPAIYAKAAQIEADLQDRRSIPVLLKLLKFEDENPQYKLFVRMNSADSLGRMRAKEAVAPISAMLAEDEANVRSAYVRALVQIGDKGSIGPLSKCATVGTWSAREFCALGLALLGTNAEIKTFDGLIKDEAPRFDKECKEGDYGEVDCAKEKEKNVTARVKTLTSYKAVLEKVATCSDNKCVEKSLTDPDPITRERAAYELGRRGAAESLPALLGAIKAPAKDIVDLNPRFAAICAVDWITAGSPEAMKAASGEANALEAQVDLDSQKVLTQKIAEEMKRLAVKLQRGAKKG